MDNPASPIDEIALLSRYLKLRKLKLIDPLLHDNNKYYFFDNPADPWGSKCYISLINLELMITTIEAGIVYQIRKPPQSETGVKSLEKQL